MKITSKIQWVTDELPDPDIGGITVIVVREGATRYAAEGSFHADDEDSAPCWHFTDGRQLVPGKHEVICWAYLEHPLLPCFPEQYEEFQKKLGEPITKVQEFIALHELLLQENPYSHFELARTRTTDWMAILATNAVDGHHDYKILAKGQGLTPEEAAQTALEDYAHKSK